MPENEQAPNPSQPTSSNRPRRPRRRRYPRRPRRVGPEPVGQQQFPEHPEPINASQEPAPAEVDNPENTPSPFVTEPEPEVSEVRDEPVAPEPEPEALQVEPEVEPERSYESRPPEGRPSVAPPAEEERGTPIGVAIELVNKVVEELKTVLDQMEQALELLEEAERQQMVDERETRQLRRALEGFHRPRPRPPQQHQGSHGPPHGGHRHHG